VPVRARYHWELALVAVGVLFGTTFVVVRDAVMRAPPFLFLALRFAVAFVVLALAGGLRGMTRSELRTGGIIGLALFAGYASQTVGLQYTSASNAGFITGMFVVFTPLIGALVVRRLPSPAAATGVLLATLGLVLLAMPSGFHLRRGDGLELLTAIAFGFHIVLIARLASALSAFRIATVQIFVTALLSFIWTIAAERAPIPGADATVWFAVALTSVLATAVAFLVQIRAQQQIPPTRTAVILTLEPVFAGITGYFVAGDRLGARGYLGAVLIVAGILVAELLAPAKEAV
jgi:drug/metabolite transporter (DMT)-like permease